MKKDKVLFVLGGLRVGDTFHVIPTLNELKKKYDDITWLAGMYEAPAVNYLSNEYHIKTIMFDDGFPMDLKSREDFAKAREADIAKIPHDILINDPCNSFDIYGSEERYVSLPVTPKCPAQPYIVVHAHSISAGKDMEVLKDIKFPCPVYCIGTLKDPLFPGAVDYRGKSLLEVHDLLVHSKLFIGIHSSMACFAFYIPEVTGIVCHFMDDGLLNFSKFNKKFTDLKRSDCTKENIERLICQHI